MTLSPSQCCCILHLAFALHVVHVVVGGLDSHVVDASHLGFVKLYV